MAYVTIPNLLIFVSFGIIFDKKNTNRQKHTHTPTNMNIFKKKNQVLRS